MWRFTLFFGLLLSSADAFAFIAGLGFAASALLTASTAATVAGAVIQYGAAKDQAKAQKQLQKAGALKAARERIQQVRQARIQAAQVAQSGAGANVSDSSSVDTGLGSIQSQLGSNLNFMDVTQIYGDKASKYLASAAKKNTLAGIVGAVGSLASTGYKAYGFNNAPKGTSSTPSLTPGTGYKADPFNLNKEFNV